MHPEGEYSDRAGKNEDRARSDDEIQVTAAVGEHDQAERHQKLGRTVYLQEPNIKNGCGGLRDYQNLLWISFFKERVQTTSGLVEKKLLNEAERRQLDRAER